MKYKKGIFVAFLLLLALATKANTEKIIAKNELDWEDYNIDIFRVEEDIRLS